MNDSDYEKIVSRTILDPPDAQVMPPDAQVMPPDAQVMPPDAQVMPPDARVSLETNIVTLLHQISHHGRQMFIEGLGRDKLSLSHWMILDELDNTKGKTMRELTEILAMPPSSVTGLVDALVERQTLERISDSEDRRIVRVRLTDTGLEYVTKIRTHLMNQYRISMNDMSQTELTLLERMYQTMLGRMLEYRQNKS